jgi:CheY-like chemotaxis protein
VLQPRKVELLLVEDNPADVRLFQEACRENETLYNLHTVQDGVLALRFLHRVGEFSLAPRPDLILLDLNLPRMSGHEVLEIVKADPFLRTIPVIVLSTSRSEEDIRKSYFLQAACYIRKPESFDEFQRICTNIQKFWMRRATLPGPIDSEVWARSNLDLLS